MRLLHILLILSFLGTSCNKNEVVEPNLLDIKIFGDLEELTLPDQLHSNSNDYSQIPSEGVTLFRKKIEQLQLLNVDIDEAVVLDSMITKDTINLESYVALFWEPVVDSKNPLNNTSPLAYQVGIKETKQYFKYYTNWFLGITWLWIDVDNIWQSSDLNEGFIKGNYWSTDIDYWWEKSISFIEFTYYDYGYYPWEGIRYDIMLNRQDKSGEIIKSHYDGWSIVVKWDVDGNGTWTHTYEDGNISSGSF